MLLNGMSKAEDLTGKEFGFLRVKARAEDRKTPSGQNLRYWLCECLICGSQKEISAQNLKRGMTKSCGCIRAAKGKAERNRKVCVICGKKFECPPSDKTVTCSPECRRIRASRASAGRKMAKQAREKISDAAKGRDMHDLQIIAVAAAKKSPKSGRFITNINAKDWHLISPEGKHYFFHSLNFWVRENCRELFGCEPDSRECCNIMSRFRSAKSATIGRTPKAKAVTCCTYKGWSVVPTEDDK